jgi:lipopolysaccharide transport system permease protein
VSKTVPLTGYLRIIRPRRAWHHVDWARLLHYRDLLFILVRRDFVARYQQTILGPAWFVLQPLVTTLAFTVVFGRVLGTPTDGVPPFLFYLCGMLGWSYFANVLNGTGNTFQSNAGIFTKVYFPRLIMPLSSVLSNLMSFVVQAATFLVFYFIFALAKPAGLHPSIPALLLLPLALLQAGALALGCGLVFSALSAKYRDFQHVLPFVAQIWMFATPVIYPLSRLSPRAQWFAAFNPMTTVVESFRIAFFGAGTLTPGYLTLSVASTLLMLFAGFALFQRAERTVADTI